MKIPASLRLLYDEQVDLYEEIQNRVKSILEPLLPETWHFEGRVKKPQSFAMKIETGRFDPKGLEDFYACTIVVPTLESADRAERLVGGHFDVVHRKPAVGGLATAGAFNFPFDHTRVYAQLRVPPGLESGPIFESRFEVQIKTFLQHAWSIATHDLTYKSSDVSWGRERVAAQVKATLESAEVAIIEADRLSRSGNPLLARQDSTTTSWIEITNVMGSEFEGSELPDDMKRLASTILATFEACRLEPAYLSGLLRRGRRARNGHPMDLSPYGVVVQYLADYQSTRLLAAMRRDFGAAIFVPAEVCLPKRFQGVPLPNARLLTDSAEGRMEATAG